MKLQSKNKKLSKKNQATKFIQNWLKTFVEVPHPVFADMPPCPFARQARLQNKIKFMEIENDFPEVSIYLAISNFDFDANEVLAMILPADQLTVTQTKQIAVTLNQQFSKSDIVILEDHPKIPEKVKSVSLNNGRYILFLAQSLSKLNKASATLKQTKYYHNWSKKYLKNVVGWRDL